MLTWLVFMPFVLIYGGVFMGWIFRKATGRPRLQDPIDLRRQQQEMEAKSKEE